MLLKIITGLSLLLLVWSPLYGADWRDSFNRAKKTVFDTRSLLNMEGYPGKGFNKPFNSSINKGRTVSLHTITTQVDKAAKKHKINASFIMAVINAESTYDNQSLSKKGAMGLMQLMPATCIDLGVTDPWNPEQNIMAGTAYLKDLILEFQDVKKGLAAYNFGPTNVRNNLPWPRETREYVVRVLERYKKFRNQEL